MQTRPTSLRAALAILLLAEQVVPRVTRADAPAGSEARTAARSSAYERIDGATLVWHGGAWHDARYVSTCRVWPDGSETCLSRVIPRPYVAPSLLGAGFGLLAGDIGIALGWTARLAACPWDECDPAGRLFRMIGTTSAIGLLGITLIGIGIRTNRRRNAGIRHLTSLPAPTSRHLELRVGTSGLMLRGSF